MTDRRDDELDEGQTESPVAPARPSPEGVRILGAEEAQAAMDAGTVGRRLGDQDTRYGDVPARPDPAIRPTVRFPRTADQEDPDVVPRASVGDDTDDEGVDDEFERGISLLDEPPASADEVPTTSMRTDGPEPAGAVVRIDDLADADDGGDEEVEEIDEVVAIVGSDLDGEDDDSVEEVLVELTDGDAAASPTLPHWSEPPTGEMPLLLPEAEPVDLTGEENIDAYTAAASTAGGPRFLTGVGDWAGEEYESMEALGDDDTNVGALGERP